jgi:predicted transcriptional regulator
MMKDDIKLKKKVTFSLSDEAIELLAEIAKRKRRNKSNMIEALIYFEADRQLAE